MNCENFNDRLPEYLEDTLSTAEQAAARDHVEKCGACQKALAQQEALEKSIRLSFHRDTQRLSLRPETKRNILSAVKRPEFRPTAWESVQGYFAVLWQHPAWAGAVVVCLAVLIFAGRRQLGSARTDNRITCVIEVPIQTEMRVYRREKNMVVDAIVTGDSVVDASFSENMRPSPSPRSRIN